ncbi:MAG: hypothetical protein LBF97_08260 [Elusimicrobiota bacterium]|jgi:hypothetical protein|nr:hypothetical protein [Elusimicrobiota bacterium]
MEFGSNPVMELTLSKLLENCIFIAIETIGVTQFLKNFIKKDCSTRRYAVLSLLWCILSAIVVIYIDGWWALIFNVCFLSLALTQICYEVIVQALPKFIGGILDNVISQAAKEK